MLGATLYAVGAVGYFLLAGRPLFEGRTVPEILFQQVNAPPKRHRPTAARPVAPELEGLFSPAWPRIPRIGRRAVHSLRPWGG